MRVTLQSTTRLVHLSDPDGLEILCRVWEGQTESGIKVQALIPRIAALQSSDLSQFEVELKEQKPPEQFPQAFPWKMVGRRSF